MAQSKIKLQISQMEPSDKVTGFSVGDAKFLALKTYFQKSAKLHHSSSIARTYLAREDGVSKIIAYMTLICGEITSHKSLAGDVQPYTYPSYPAIKVARLLVDSAYRGKEVGRTLIEMAVGVAKDVVCPSVGCRFVVVDAKTDSIKFYKACGFTFLDTSANRKGDEHVMFIDLHKAA